MQKNYFLKAVFTLLLCSYFSFSYAADWYISSTGNDTSGDGLTAGTPWASFSKAQTAAATGDVIYVSGMIDFSLEPGLVQPVGVAITKNLTIQGTSNTTDGFDGKELTRFFSNSTFVLTLKNLKLINGYSGNNNGGAVINTSTGTLNCENVVFDGNKTGMNTVFTGANKTGGAIHFDNATGSTFKNCVFSNNQASKTGAFYINAWAANSTILFEGCAFLGNTAKETFGGSAVFIRANTSANTTCNIVNSTFKGNHVNSIASGGAISINKAPSTATVNIINCTVSGNTTAATPGHSAGVHFNNSDAALDASFYIKNCIIENNTAAGGVAADLNLTALSATAPGGTTGYMHIEKSIIGRIALPANIVSGTNYAAGDAALINHLPTAWTTNDLKAGLAPFNETTNSFSLYAGSAAIGYGNSAVLTPYSIKDQLGNIRTVGATNYAGSWESTPLATTTPDAPTALVATAGDGQISVAFISAATGGSLITNYKYSVNDGAYVTLDPAQTAGPIVITGLTNGTAYTVKLKAVNANGESAESVVSNSATPTVATGLDNILNKITIFRNSNNQIVVNNTYLKTGTITVCNALGQRIVSTTLNGASTTVNKSLKSGVYLVLVNIDGKSSSTKIIL